MEEFCSSAPKSPEDIEPEYRKRVIRISVVEWIPFLDVNETETSVKICGPMARLLDDLRITLDFNFTLNIPPDVRSPGHYNDTHPTKSPGVLGMIVRNEADMSGLPLLMDGDLYGTVVSFSDEVFLDHYNILSPKLNENSSFFSYFFAFDLIVWILLFFAIIALSVAHYFLDIVYSKKKKNVNLIFWKSKKSRQREIEEERRERRRRKSSSRITPISIPTISQENRELSQRDIQVVPDANDLQRLHAVSSKALMRKKREPRRIPNILNEFFSNHLGIFYRISINQAVVLDDPVSNDPIASRRETVSRFLIIIFWFSSITMIGCFSGNLLSNILKESPVIQIDSLNDVLHLHDDHHHSHLPSLKLIAVKGDPILTDLMEREDSYKYNLEKKITFVPSDEITTDRTTDLVIKGTHSILINRISIESIMASRGSCHFYVGSEILLPSSYGFAARKGYNQTFMREVNKRLRQLRATGVLNQWLWSTISNERNETECKEKEYERKYRSLQLKDLDGNWIILLLGVASSLSVMLIEFVIQDNTMDDYIHPLRRQVSRAQKNSWREFSDFFDQNVRAKFKRKIHEKQVEMRMRAMSLAVGTSANNEIANVGRRISIAVVPSYQSTKSSDINAAFQFSKHVPHHHRHDSAEIGRSRMRQRRMTLTGGEGIQDIRKLRRNSGVERKVSPKTETKTEDNDPMCSNRRQVVDVELHHSQDQHEAVSITSSIRSDSIESCSSDDLSQFDQEKYEKELKERRTARQRSRSLFVGSSAATQLTGVRSADRRRNSLMTATELLSPFRDPDDHYDSQSRPWSTGPSIRIISDERPPSVTIDVEVYPDRWSNEKK